MKKTSISLCMIVKNEERCIERCLDSVASIVDEIIIVDTGSTDRTLELIKKYEVKLYHYVWDNHFANARNYAIDQAKGDYILHLDADEWLEDPHGVINHSLENDIYYIPIRNELEGGLAEVHKFPRLFRRIPELRYHGALHEQIDIGQNWHRSSMVLSKALIYHDGYLQQIISRKNKNDRNLSILLAEIEEKPTPFNYYNLGQQYFANGDFMKAVEAYKKSYSFGNQYTFTKRLLVGLIQSLISLKKYAEALAIAEDSFILYPDYVEFKYYEGLIYKELGYLPDATECFKLCINMGDSDPSINFNTYEGTGSYLAYARLFEISFKSADFIKAEQYLNEAISQAPLVRALFKYYLKLHNHLSDPELFSKVLELWPQREEVLQPLITVLYKLRHSLLLEFAKAYSINVDEKVAAFVNLLQGEFNAAADFWYSHDIAVGEEAREVRLLSLLIGDEKLAGKAVADAPISDNEKNAFINFIKGEANPVKLFSKEYGDIIYELTCDVIKLRKYEQLDRFFRQFNTSQMRYILARALFEYGFYEMVLEVIIEGSNADEKYDINLLVAKTLRIQDCLNDSLFYYMEAFKIKQEPEVAFHICDLAIALNDISTLKFVLGSMVEWKVKSKWVTKYL